MDRKKLMIVGGSSGIGRGLAQLYAQRNWQVGVTGRRAHELQTLLQQHPQQIITSSFDINAIDAVQKTDELITQLNGIDLFIFCAGSAEISDKPNWNTDEPVIQTNTVAFAKLLGHIFNYFLTQPHGQIVIISSIAALHGGPSAPAYNASKAFQRSMAESLNLQAAALQKNIVVTDIIPGYVDTDMGKGDFLFGKTPLQKACKQILSAIDKKKRKAVVSHRWKPVAFAMKYMPDWVFMLLAKKR